MGRENTGLVTIVVVHIYPAVLACVSLVLLANSCTSGTSASATGAGTDDLATGDAQGNPVTEGGDSGSTVPTTAAGTTEAEATTSTSAEPTGGTGAGAASDVETSLSSGESMWPVDSGETSAGSSSGGMDTTTGAASCEGLSTIQGDMWLELPADKAVMSGVECLDGNLYVLGTVENLSGLEALQFISGDLVFANDGPLPDALGLSALKAVGGSLVVVADSQIKDFSGLESLKSIGDNLQISTSGLTTLNGLQGVSSIANNIGIGDIRQNVPSLLSLEALSGVTELTHDLLIYGTGIATLEGLQNLKDIGGVLEIVGNHSLPTCTATSFAEKTSPSKINIKANLADGCGN